MPQHSKKYRPSRIRRALVTAGLCALLSGCSASATAVKTEPQRVPALYLRTTPPPPVPDENTMTDNQLAALLQNQDKALAACNADKDSIRRLVIATP